MKLGKILTVFLEIGEFNEIGFCKRWESWGRAWGMKGKIGLL